MKLLDSIASDIVLLWKNELQIVNKFLTIEQDLHILQAGFVLLLKQFSLSFDELLRFFENFIFFYRFS